MNRFDVSMVVPTYNEVKNISKILKKIFLEFKKNKINGEVIVVDDGSPDGTAKIVKGLQKKYKNLILIERGEKIGLSSAVLDGFKKSRSDVVGVIDGDLSHPVEKISEMFNLIRTNKADIVIGSRYIKKGKIVGWGLLRKILSLGAIFLSKPFTSVNDPMTGFFILRKELINYKKLNSKGFKILLEILVKIKPKRVMEVPITFTNRVEGKSKAGFKEIFLYLQNLFGYKEYFKTSYKEFFKYLFVGFLGTLVNLFFFFMFTSLFRIFYLVSAVFSFFVAVTFNYFLNKTWTFREEIDYKIFIKWGKFLSVSVVGLGINLFFLYLFTEIFGIYYLVSQIFAIVFTTFWNFLGNKFWTFRKV